MTEQICLISSLIIVILTSVGMYLYLVKRKFEKIIWSKRWMMIYLLLIAVAVFIFLFGYYYMGKGMVKTLMEAETFVWLITLGYIDYKELVIPNKLIVFQLVFWVFIICVDLFLLRTPWKEQFLFSLFGAGICGGVLLIIASIFKNSIGMGDVKLFFTIGLLYGVMDTYSILLYSLIIMAVVSIVLLVMKKANKKTMIPMAPFVIFGFLINCFWQ